MNMIEQIKADREAGTHGKWMEDETHNVVKFGSDGYVGHPPHPDAIASLYDGEYIENPNYKVDARRIARVPDMEAALIAADELANSVQAEFETIGCSALLHSEMMKFRAAIGAT